MDVTKLTGEGGNHRDIFNGNIEGKKGSRKRTEGPPAAINEREYPTSRLERLPIQVTGGAARGYHVGKRKGINSVPQPFIEPTRMLIHGRNRGLKPYEGRGEEVQKSLQVGFVCYLDERKSHRRSPPFSCVGNRPRLID